MKPGASDAGNGTAAPLEPPEMRMARTPLALGAMVFCAIGLAGPLTLGLTVVDALLVAALVAAVPALAFAQHDLLTSIEIERIPLYWGSILTLWLMGSAVLVVGSIPGGVAAVGLTVISFGRLLAWSLALAGVGLATIWVFRALGRMLDRPDPAILGRLLPTTSAERRVFLLLSASAGLCEELAYRGYLIGVLAPRIGTAPAVVIASVGFGLVHVYQGPLGMVRAAVIGAALAVGFLVAGSLWPAVVAHAAVDVIAGIFVGERLLSHEHVSGVESEDPVR
jgi:membrane protease YdiL (CAAX protease family)